MKNILLLFAIILLFSSCDQGPTQALISTEYGEITVELFDETPIHRDNFIKLAKEGFYEDLLFHRVIGGFMIQGGDPDSKDAGQGVQLGQGGPGYTLDAEIGHGYHVQGALAAARLGDSANPERKSSGSQFYIVEGRPINDALLDQIEQNSGITYSAEDRQRYIQNGGYPPLDGQYTVFGQVIDGMDVVKKIATVPVDQFKRPLQDVRMSVEIIN
jgi:cyclophilin family peptidyl-prolyl cis-trans isomerase